MNDHVEAIKSKTWIFYLSLLASTQHPSKGLCYTAQFCLTRLPCIDNSILYSATRIDQSSLRCLLCANNFSFLLSNSEDVLLALDFCFLIYLQTFDYSEYECCRRNVWCCYWVPREYKLCKFSFLHSRLFKLIAAFIWARFFVSAQLRLNSTFEPTDKTDHFFTFLLVQNTFSSLFFLQ